MTSNWKNRFYTLACLVGDWSKQDKKVGAVLVDDNRLVRGVGYNGAPKTFNDESVTAENSTFVVIHAEINALQNSVGDQLTMIVNCHPCLACAAAIVASKRVKAMIFPPIDNAGRWTVSQQQAIEHLKEKGIEVTFCHENIHD